MAGQLARSRFDDVVAIRAEDVQVLLRGRMGKHVEVHGGCHEHGCLGRQVGGDEHVIGYAVRHFTNGGGGSRCDEHGICPQAEVDVAVPRAVSLCKEFTDNRFAGESRQGDGCDKFFSCRSDDNLHLGTALDQRTDDVAGFISCNAAGDAQHYFFPL
ncbi:hypothetical protein SDC9_160462 [bioreactor metagenome]|uniref:Uncharacterized protein n=1 Tax=bioreactor metagenome TaxID=1076179 RepID=A0A645FHZ2_9ZZZZ